MTRRVAFVVILVFACACACRKDIVSVPDCSDVDRDRLAQLVVECARAANPMSDEEGEDLVRECRLSIKDTFCPKSPAWVGVGPEVLLCRLNPRPECKP